MIIKGKHRTVGFGFVLIFFLGCSYAIFHFAYFGFGSEKLSGKIAVTLVTVMAWFIFGKMLYDTNLIRIDTDAQRISFKNIFTQKRKSYSFLDFEGKLVCNEPIKGGSIRNFYLIKNKRAVRKISKLMYSNQNELEESLHDIKDLGSFEYSYKKSWKISLGLPILD